MSLHVECGWLRKNISHNHVSMGCQVNYISIKNDCTKIFVMVYKTLDTLASVTWNNPRQIIFFLMTHEHHTDRMSISILLIIYSCKYLKTAYMVLIWKLITVYKWKISTNIFDQWQLYCDNSSWNSFCTWSMPPAESARKIWYFRLCVIHFKRCWDLLLTE